MSLFDFKSFCLSELIPLKSKPNSGEDSLRVKYKGNSPLALKENKERGSTTVAAYLTNKTTLEAFGKRRVDLYKESDLLNENQIKPDLP